MLVSLFTAAVEAPKAGVPEVADAAICKDVIDRMPVEAGISFNAPVGKSCCSLKQGNMQTQQKWDDRKFYPYK